MRKLRRKNYVNKLFGIVGLCWAFWPQHAAAQQLITFAGSQSGSADGAYLGWSVGELLIQPLASKTAYLTQGFRQPEVNTLPNEEDSKACARNNGLTIYNGITPNGDKVNDVLRIDGIERFPSNQLYIFNRWNTILYQKENYGNDNAWGGTDQNGSALPAGIYYYRLYLDPKEVQQFCEGRILIVR